MSRLNEFSVGLLADEAQIDIIGRHLDQCEQCRRLVERASTSVDLRHSAATRFASEIPEEVLDQRREEFCKAMIPQTIGKYRIEGVIDRGGMSTVYRSHHPSLHQAVAVKSLSGTRKLSEPSRRSLISEQKTLGKIRHPSIVSVMDAGLDNGIPFIVMEHVEGRNLADIVRRDGPLSPTDACAVLAAVCDALVTLHEAGYVHQDVKPGNVMLTDHGVPKLLDLGLAIHMTDQNPRIGGTPRFIAPEQVAGAPERRSDLYAIGASFLYLVSGERPPKHCEPDRDKQIQRWLKGVPNRIRKLIWELLQLDPKARPESLVKVRDEFARFGLKSTRIDLRHAIGVAASIPKAHKRAGVIVAGTAGLVFAAVMFLIQETDHVRPRGGIPFVADAAPLPRNVPGLLPPEQVSMVQRQIETIFPRSYPANAVWSPIGDRVACFGQDGALRVYDVVDDHVQRVRVLPCFSDSDVEIPQIQWISERHILAGASVREDLKLLDLEDLSSVRSIPHEAEVLDTDWDAKNDRLALVDMQGSLRIYSPAAALIDVKTGFVPGAINSVSFAPDGERIATLGSHGDLSVLRADDLSILARVNLETASRCIAWHPMDDRLFAGTEDGTVIEIDIENGASVVARHQLARGVIASMQWNAKGSLLAVGGWDTVVWDPVTNSSHELNLSRSYNWSTVDWHLDKLVLASFDQGLTIWDAKAKSSKTLLESSLQQVISIAWNPSRQEAAISTMTGNLFVVDGKGNLVWHDSPTEDELSLGSLCWSPDGSRLCGVSDWESDCYVWDADSHSRVATIRVEKGVLAANWASNEVLVTGGTNGLVQWFGLDATREIASVKLNGTIRDLTCERSRERVAVANSDGGIVIIDQSDVGRPKVIKTWLDTELIRSVDWSPDASHLGVTTQDGKICLVSVETGEIERTLDKRAQRPQGLRWASSGNLLAVGDSGIFDAITMQRRSRIPIRCYAHAWIEGDSQILAGTWTGTVGCYSAESGDLNWKMVLHRSGEATVVRPDGNITGPKQDHFVSLATQ